MGHGGDVAALPHSRRARPSPLCNLNRPRPVKEFAQCFRARACYVPPGQDFTEKLCPAALSTGSGRVAMYDFIKRFANGVFYPEEVQILVAVFDDAWSRLQSSHAPFAEEAHAPAAREILAEHISGPARRA